MLRALLSLGLAMVALPGQEPVPAIVTGTPNRWFTRTKLDLGVVQTRHTAIGEFPFANPTGKLQRWRNLAAGG